MRVRRVRGARAPRSAYLVAFPEVVFRALPVRITEAPSRRAGTGSPSRAPGANLVAPGRRPGRLGSRRRGVYWCATARNSGGDSVEHAAPTSGLLRRHPTTERSRGPCCSPAGSEMARTRVVRRVNTIETRPRGVVLVERGLRRLAVRRPARSTCPQPARPFTLDDSRHRRTGPQQSTRSAAARGPVCAGRGPMRGLGDVLMPCWPG